MRVDIWDVKPKEDLEALDAGLPKNFDSLFELGATLGKGGFGLVRVATEKATGQEYACKSVCKRLNIPNLSAAKQAAHIDNIKREIAILKRLRGTLSVVVFKGAYEDDEDIHILMELCRGGELEHELGRRPYSEKLVAGYMRSVLYTLAQCHSLHILHRDIKPGNFMLLTTEIDSPLKAIDFGLAVFYDPAKLPRTDLGLEGTTWFMAPETLSSDVYPASDVWAAGVMAYQLLSGVLPFNDRRNPNSPSLSLIWRSILTDTPSFTTSAWSEVSEEGKDFVRKLLEKDHKKRPSAKDMLGHAWLQSSFYTTNARPISASVVQRLQRFSQAPMLKRSILELIAAELLEVAPPQLDPSVHGMSSYSSNVRATASLRAASKEPGKSAEASAHEKNQRARMRDGSGPPSSEGSAHGEKEYWRVLRAASELALMGSQHGKTKALEYLHTHPRSEEEIGEQRKAARLALDTSTHGGSDYDRLLRRLEEESKRPDKSPGAAPPSSVDPGAVTVTTPAELSRLMRKMRFRPGEALSAEALCEALHRLGYHLEPSEVSMLLRELDRDADGAIHPSEFVASQLDWGAMQQSNRDLWLECARRAFSGLDTDKDGRVDADALLSVLRSKLPAAEVDYAVEHAMVEAGHADADDMDFEGFLRLLHMDAGEASDALHLYDARMPADLTPDLDPTVHNNGSFGRLDSIEEAA
ncbi:Calcium-dependent protein kinase 29 [Auxenochlorella protothecoides]|uniref:Calcium-dependent protein kinase 29 n=1 Tax=Auxenochlorella protothecoides TaxID=3075 RepID=A0A087SMG5_AUXPR|nr:Calcium-dependent protein kinase 29 [Auxenochlorella protothecoides]KFM26919.1 Calcium-dependent protein kinase 29 [Auxenochlorella protothecoides]